MKEKRNPATEAETPDVDGHLYVRTPEPDEAADSLDVEGHVYVRTPEPDEASDLLDVEGHASAAVVQLLKMRQQGTHDGH